uniref:Uncharacterized protein n=1 Tax=Morchella brunnea TaxID=1174671 RepID=A0A8K1I5J1_9PEZI|nr:hypothetical protein LK370_mgp156 [Morchella brunnea]UBU98375.1 hypothetical protein [Morchella brunnea]
MRGEGRRPPLSAFFYPLGRPRGPQNNFMGTPPGGPKKAVREGEPGAGGGGNFGFGGWLAVPSLALSSLLTWYYKYLFIARFPAGSIFNSPTNLFFKPYLAACGSIHPLLA